MTDVFRLDDTSPPAPRIREPGGKELGVRGGARRSGAAHQGGYVCLAVVAATVLVASLAVDRDAPAASPWTDGRLTEDTGLHAEARSSDSARFAVAARPFRFRPVDLQLTIPAVAPAVVFFAAVLAYEDLRRRRLAVAPVCLRWMPRARGLRAPPGLLTV